MNSAGRTTSREAQRLATRERVFAAAVDEFAKSGVAGADVGAIIRAAKVSHGTFYFHFPTKEHVIAELGQREEVRMAAEFDRFLGEPRTLRQTLTTVTEMATALEERVGSILFKEVLALYFSPNRPELQLWPDHPLISAVIAEFGAAQERGEVEAGAHPANSAMIFLLGLYALLIVQERDEARGGVLAQFVTTVLRGVEPR